MLAAEHDVFDQVVLPPTGKLFARIHCEENSTNGPEKSIGEGS